METEGTYHDRLEHLQDTGKLKIALVVAPPRTSSTLAESAIAASPDATWQCHEPFIRVGYNGMDPEYGYKNIYDCIDGDELAKSNQNGLVVVKEMSHWLLKNDEYQRLLNLADKPVIFLTRNPVLALESRIKKVIKAIDMKPRVSTQQWMLEHLSQTEWQLPWHQSPQDISMLGIGRSSDLYSQPTQEVQQALLNYYSRNQGYEDWQTLVNTVFKSQDYSQIGELLFIDSQRFSLEPSPWLALEKQIAYARNAQIPYAVIDSTELRLDPRSVFTAITELWGIRSSEQMIMWDKPNLHGLHTDQKRPHDLIWYDTLANSTGIQPPTEVPITPASFPQSLAQHLIDTELPSYMRVFADPNRIKISNPQIDMRMVDPIFAAISQPELLRDSEFISTNASYGEFLNVVKQTYEID